METLKIIFPSNYDTPNNSKKQHPAAPFFCPPWLSAGFYPHLSPSPISPPIPLSLPSLPAGARLIDRSVTTQFPGTFSLFQLWRTEEEKGQREVYRAGGRQREEEKGERIKEGRPEQIGAGKGKYIRMIFGVCAKRLLVLHVMIQL